MSLKNRISNEKSFKVLFRNRPEEIMANPSLLRIYSSFFEMWYTSPDRPETLVLNEFIDSDDIVTPWAFKIILKWIDNVILLIPHGCEMFMKHEDFLDWASEVYEASEYLGIH